MFQAWRQARCSLPTLQPTLWISVFSRVALPQLSCFDLRLDTWGHQISVQMLFQNGVASSNAVRHQIEIAHLFLLWIVQSNCLENWYLDQGKSESIYRYVFIVATKSLLAVWWSISSTWQSLGFSKGPKYVPLHSDTHCCWQLTLCQDKTLSVWGLFCSNSWSLKGGTIISRWKHSLSLLKGHLFTGARCETTSESSDPSPWESPG